MPTEWHVTALLDVLEGLRLVGPPSVRGGVADGVKACQRRHRLGGPC
eukprot:CAMPEP_0119522592 /NCGR_PEP_ID=MMETSP1344-20130328/37883_1 /TAXON_ID=236787 /ORGANISM="Florenciella parvula, Strain CCMP2471" /LENGTH=46 /DNA_ID= /DNA_START= /DNA_END= /DNA_ORIENTATION=